MPWPHMVPQATHLYSSILMSVLLPRRYTTDRGSDLSTFALASWRQRRGRRPAGAEILRVDRRAGPRARVTLRPEPPHVTRDVQAEASRGGVAGASDALRRLPLYGARA